MALVFLNKLPKIFVRNASSSSINRFTLRTHNCGELRLEHVGQRVKIYGWLNSNEENKFLWVKDAYGKVQALAPDHMKDLIKSLKRHSSLCVEGTVMEREKDRKNSRIPTEEIQVFLVFFLFLGR
ncbi:unnamed protein product [Meloidogyne enterolobii]|uniref:Uncharacterized protein n=1 Tax=Meloidogyne enterolobii TaxID=390850 RepID=A0ACB0XZ40_MELEN